MRRRRGIPTLEAKKAEGTGKSSPRLPDFPADATAKGREPVVPTGLSSKVRRPGKVSVSDTKKRPGSQKEEREGVVTMAAGATKCPLDWPPAVTRDGGKIGHYSNGCHLGAPSRTGVGREEAAGSGR